MDIKNPPTSPYLMSNFLFNVSILKLNINVRRQFKKSQIINGFSNLRLKKLSSIFSVIAYTGT